MAKKITKKKVVEEKPVVTEEMQNKQLRNIIVVMCVIILAAFLTYYIVQKAAHPDYKGLQFSKRSFGIVNYYAVSVPAIDPFTGEVKGYNEIDLRNNPLDLGKINFSGDLRLHKNITMSFSKAIEGCNDTIIGVANFAKVLNGDLGFNIKGATTNENYAKEVNMTYATCENAGNETVIILQNASLGGPTSIKSTIKDCYVIDVNKCETLPALERFILEVAVKSQGK